MVVHELITALLNTPMDAEVWISRERVESKTAYDYIEPATHVKVIDGVVMIGQKR